MLKTTMWRRRQLGGALCGGGGGGIEERTVALRPEDVNVRERDKANVREIFTFVFLILFN